jgi:hypothetical protein
MYYKWTKKGRVWREATRAQVRCRPPRNDSERVLVWHASSKSHNKAANAVSVITRYNARCASLKRMDGHGCMDEKCTDLNNEAAFLWNIVTCQSHSPLQRRGCHVP